MGSRGWDDSKTIESMHVATLLEDLIEMRGIQGYSRG